QAAISGLPDETFEIAPCGGLAAGEMHLQASHFGGLPQHAQPDVRSELFACALKREGVGTIGALQRTAVRQLREQCERWCHVPHSSITPLSVKSCTSFLASLSTTSRGASKAAQSSSMISESVIFPLQRETIA